MNKHNAELQRADPGTKVTGEFSTRGHILLETVFFTFKQIEKLFILLLLLAKIRSFTHFTLHDDLLL